MFFPNKQKLKSIVFDIVLFPNPIFIDITNGTVLQPTSPICTLKMFEILCCKKLSGVTVKIYHIYLLVDTTKVNHIYRGGKKTTRYLQVTFVNHFYNFRGPCKRHVYKIIIEEMFFTIMIHKQSFYYPITIPKYKIKPKHHYWQGFVRDKKTWREISLTQDKGFNIT